MGSSRLTSSRSRRRIRLRSVEVPFFLVTVKPTRIGPSSSRRRLCTTKAALFTRAPLATARKSARCLNRSMVKSPGSPGSGAQTLAAARTAGGEDLAAAGRRKTSAEAVTALAHQFAGLISPLHGSFSADNLPVKLTICLSDNLPDIEVSPVMLAGPNQAVSGPNEPPRSVGPGHRGQLARLIRERPVFVNLAARRIPQSSKCPQLARIYQSRWCFSVGGWLTCIPTACCRFGQCYCRSSYGSQVIAGWRRPEAGRDGRTFDRFG